MVSGDGGVTIIKYSAEGVEVVTKTESIETYLRDQVDINPLYEYENKLLIDDNIKGDLTKEGQKRFARHFVSPKKLAKKMTARLSF